MIFCLNEFCFSTSLGSFSFYLQFLVYFYFCLCVNLTKRKNKKRSILCFWVCCRYWEIWSLSVRLSLNYLRSSELVIIIASFVALHSTIPHLRTSACQANARAHNIIDRAHLRSITPYLRSSAPPKAATTNNQLQLSTTFWFLVYFSWVIYFCACFLLSMVLYFCEYFILFIFSFSFLFGVCMVGDPWT